MGFVKENPSAWSPIISAWCIDILGDVSSDSAGRTPPAASLNELLQRWMRCPPTKVLIELTSECFASMLGDAPDVCVDALLEASVKHSPHFDWVVAHIGSCFPKTIINRVLLCGLKDFHAGSQPDSSPVAAAEKIPKMASVMGILGHLASHHGRQIRSALHSLFQVSLGEAVSPMYQMAVPFLLQLASMSPVLLKAISMDASKLLTIPVMNKLSIILTKLCLSGGQDSNSLMDLLVQLLTRVEKKAYDLFLFLLKHACQERPESDAMETDHNEEVISATVHGVFVAVLDRLLLELQRKVHSRASLDVSQDVPCLATLQAHLPEICRLCDSQNKMQVRCASRLLASLAACGKEGQAAEVLCQLLQHTHKENQLSLVVQIQQGCQVKYPEVLHVTLGQLFDQLCYHQQSAEAVFTTVNNLLNVLKWEEGLHNQSKQETRSSISESLQQQLPGVCRLMQCDYLPLAGLGMQLLGLCGLPAQPTQAILTHLATSSTSFFFTALHSTDSGKKFEYVYACQRCLQRLSKIGPCLQKMLLRLLLESALSQKHAQVFGATLEQPSQVLEQISPLLMEANQHHHMGHMGHQPHGTVFHGGVIGRGLKTPHHPSPFTKEQQLHHRQLLVGALSACGTPLGSVAGIPSSHCDSTLEPDERIDRDDDVAQRQMALVKDVVARLLVELVEPDVMHTAIAPWPEEEFLTVTLERDLQIKRRFEENAVLWDIMEFVSTGEYCMCHCSVLLRSVLATLLGFWESCRDKSACNAPRELATTCRILDCLGKGGLLPPPLNCCSEMLHLLAPYEVHLILLGVWRFMKEYPPIPEPGRVSSSLSKQPCEAQYTEALRAILHSNINKLGHYYPRFFHTHS